MEIISVNTEKWKLGCMFLVTPMIRVYVCVTVERERCWYHLPKSKDYKGAGLIWPCHAVLYWKKKSCRKKILFWFLHLFCLYYILIFIFTFLYFSLYFHIFFSLVERCSVEFAASRTTALAYSGLALHLGSSFDQNGCSSWKRRVLVQFLILDK